MACQLNRMNLHEQLPLSSPLSIHIFSSFYCNFKCRYCLHSLDTDDLQEMGFQKQFMEFQVYQKAIDDIASHHWHLKALIFAGHGEPLLHPDIAAMVAYAKERKISDRIEVVTNGSLLTHSLSDALIAAGLDRLRISLQGVSADQYKEMSGIDIDFAKFIEQLQYFYEHKTETEVYIKVIDLALKNPGDAERFEALCRGASDLHAIEYAIPFVQEIDLGELSGNCKQGNCHSSRICSMPFYMMALYPNGDVLPCCSTKPPLLGNILQDNLKKIWESRERNNFLIQQLNGAKTIPVCSACSVPQFGLQEGDYLDGYEDELISVYQNQCPAHRSV